MDQELRRELREVMTHRALRSALKEILEEADAHDRLIGQELTTAQGVALANKAQGVAEGMYRFLDRLFELAKKEEVEDEPNINEHTTI